MHLRTMLLAAGSMAILLGGCAMDSTNYNALKTSEASGSAFSQNLFEGYKALAVEERAEHDVADSEYFAAKALATRDQVVVEPQAIYERRLPAGTAGDLQAAREDLMAALRAGAAHKVTDQAAQAQVMFDCWVQEQEENSQPNDIAACREGFEDAMGAVQVAMKLAPKMAKVPTPTPSDAAYIVYFDFNSAELSDGAAAILAEAATAAAKVNGSKILLDGNADRAGPQPYNKKLSEARAEAVRQALMASGMAAAAIKVQAHGEGRPAIKTADGVREAGNRRVEISIQR